LQNPKRKYHFEGYGACGAVGDIRTDIIEAWRLSGLTSSDTENDRKYWRFHSKKARKILIH